MRYLILLVAFCTLLSVAYAAESVQVRTTEAGRITSYFNAYWVVNVDGNITITNPTVRDLYDIEIRYDILSLSLIETGGTSYFQNGNMLIPRIPANSSVTASYNIVGITLEDPTLTNKGVLYTGMTKFAPIIYSDTFGVLNKASLENESITGRSGRLVSVELRNPTGFQFTIESLRVFKTPQLDPNDVMQEWRLINSTSPVTIDSESVFVRDILDTDSAEGEVYWLSADVFISHVTFSDLSNLSRYNEENLTVPPEFLNYTLNLTNETNRSLHSTNEIYAKKISSQRLVTTEQPVEISIIVNNFAPKLFDFTITDELPPGFSFSAGDGWQEVDGKLVFTGKVGGKSAVVPSYSALLIDKETAGLDYFSSSRIDYTTDTAEKTVFSDTVPFIRQYLPDKKLYVQKRLLYMDDDEVTVTITVQNLGSSPVQNLLLKEYLDDADVFSQITEQPTEKGLWEIKELKSGQEWEVSYVTTTDSTLNILPGLFGVPSGDVLRSLILENVISSAWEVMQMAGVELAGIVLLIGLPILYYFMRKKTPAQP
jgi:hypothetical protein